MKKSLKQSERIVVGLAYFILLFVLYICLGNNFSSLSSLANDTSVWFYSGALLIILGAYVTEPFFSKPTDTIASSISLLLALLGITNKRLLFGYYVIFIYAVIILIIAITAVLLKDRDNRLKEITYFITKTLGTSKVMFSTIYLASAFSYFAKKSYLIEFGIMLILWSCLVMGDPVGWILLNIKRMINVSRKSKSAPLGRVIRCVNPNVNTIELFTTPNNSLVGSVVCIKQAKNVYAISVITDQYNLLDRVHVDTYTMINVDFQNQKELLESIYGAFLSLDLEATARLVNLHELPKNISTIVADNDIYNRIDQYIGTVMANSDINIIKIAIRQNSNCKVREGAIIQSSIYGSPVLYQLINGVTMDDEVDRQNDNRYIMGVARKLGIYNDGSLDVVPWTPNAGEAVYLYSAKDVSQIELSEIAQAAIGRLPGTNLGITLKEPNSLVTHNTAILGILGIGKSCLAFELLRKLSENSVKIVCIDITNQYYSDNGLFPYYSTEEIVNDFDEVTAAALSAQYMIRGGASVPSSWGNQLLYREKLKQVLRTFMESDKKIFIINPEKHDVSRAASLFNIADFYDLTVVEKTRIISECLLNYCSEKGQTNNARCLIVYEEAHTLVPEWNSVSASGDQTAANGISKVIMQGRKYGLGCFVITQRTANVTKSILNQCNTIFALRMFDDTGKAFLENYIGQDYSSSISTLEERHCIAIGKALRLKQPVIIQLNDCKFFYKKPVLSDKSIN